MSTPFVHTLLSWDTYDADDAGDVEGRGHPTIGRTNWEFTLEVAEVTSVTVVVQGSPVDDDDDYATIGTFNSGAITSTGTYTLTAPTDFTVQPYHEWLRAKITAQTDDATVRAIGSAPFLDPDKASEAFKLSEELRDYSEVDRIVERAERTVRQLLLSSVSYEARAGFLSVVGPSAGLYDDIQDMVAEQADWLYRRMILGRKRDGDSAAALEDMDTVAPDIMDAVRRMQYEDQAYWRGR